MWNDSYKQYVKDLVISNRGDYPYYIAVTNTNISTNYNTEYPSFKVYFSKDPITATGLYNYVLPSNSLVYSVIGGNASGTYHSKRVSAAPFSGNLTVNNYEFVYTNAEFSSNTIQPDILATNQVKQSHFDGVALIVLAVLLGSIVVKFIRR